VESAEQARRDAVLAAEAGADMVELRVDELTESFPLPEMPLPYILTCRPAREGGGSELSDADRLDLLAEFAEFGVESGAAYMDVELATYIRRPDIADLDRLPSRLIVSVHDFKGRPPISRHLVEMAARRANVHKLAWLARSIRDNIEAFELLREPLRPTIALCMGEAGLLSRVLAKKFGAFLTYAALRPSEVTAPGQPTIEQMKRLYRWDAIDADTRVYGVVGAPVAHSLSPAVHNAAFEHARINAVYLPMLVQPGYESFKAFMEEFLAFKPLDLRGLSVTIPHKENTLRYLREKGATIDPLAREVGAVNTIEIDASGALSGFNTDYAAIVDTVCAALKRSPEELGKKRVAVIGAGGTARTAVAAMAKLGATVVVYNRTKEKAEQLAREFDGKSGKVVAARLEKLCDSCCHVFINTTPVGMHPDVDESPLGERLPKFSPETLVFDTIYNPSRTKLLRQAEQAGARTVGGAAMFIRQAAKQFEIWTNVPAPVDVMRRAFEGGAPA
jgi:3-dehydroquinate dehydratase/shikimate dehydrogenase